ncbi:MAG: hypothetical protein ACK4N5_06920, partial [Myxococcales bacterium]
KNPNPNGKVIGESGTDDGKLTMRMAPNHSGIEGSRYGVVTLGVSINGFTSGERLAMSGLVNWADALPYGTEVKYTAGFPGFSDAGKYDYRTGTYTGAKAVTDATLHRAVFKDRQGRAWVVYFKGTTFKVPAAATGFGDRTLYEAPTSRSSTATERSPYTIQALIARHTTGNVDAEALFTFNETNADHLVEFTQGFSVYDFDRPLIAISEPANNATVAGNATYKAKVTNFAVPTEGKVQFRALQGTTVRGTAEAATVSAQGEASAAFSPALAPGDYTIEARLIDPQGNPLDPVVDFAIAVKVNP